MIAESATLGYTIQRIKEVVGKAIVGKEEKIDLILAALFAGGNVLLEDVPGTGKTVLAKTQAKSFDCKFKRIQFTPDLLPADLIGINYFNQKEQEFIFREGALFTNILLADEINRATPRTQAALLEAMEEKQITVDGVTYPLKPPFFVIATQNPVEIQGTFPLPEAQLDRFLIRISLGYTETEETMKIIERYIGTFEEPQTETVCDREILLRMQKQVKEIYVHQDVARYTVKIIEKTREQEEVVLGVSTRGVLALLRTAQAYAAIRERSFVTPEDIQALAYPVLGHRMILRGSGRSKNDRTQAVIQNVLTEIEVPTERFAMKG